MAAHDPASAAAARIDPDALARDASALVAAPSVTGDEGLAVARLGALATALGLEARPVEHDLAAVRALPGYPGQVAERDRLLGLEVVLPATDPDAGRLLLHGHVDVVHPGPLAWSRSPWSGAIEGGRLHGRGSLDMKGAVVACLHAMAAVRDAGDGPRGEIVLHAVSSEEDGGQGAFAGLARDHDFAACVIPEPAGLAVVCAHGGSIQLEGVVTGRSTHAATRLAGISALDRYLPLHEALARLEGELNADVANPLMRALELPYPVVVGRIEAGRWVSQVPDELRFLARVGVPVGSDVETVWARVQEVLGDALVDDGVSGLRLRRLGAFRPAATSTDDPLVGIACDALAAETGRPARLAGVPWGADMQHVVAHGIPCVMVGTTGIERAHGVDEWVDLGELALVARTLARIASRRYPRG